MLTRNWQRKGKTNAAKPKDAEWYVVSDENRNERIWMERFLAIFRCSLDLLGWVTGRLEVVTAMHFR
ncbi:unnamed protein product [Orchesella dallaii]|uniref:Uncharacterized protein n=1 Tax=Orchesella dallaii TaxID=48710 RepID=A0ABP1PY14_9HEXA